MLAPHAVWGHELWRHDPYCVTKVFELARPIVGTGAGLHTNETGRQASDEFEQLAPLDIWTYQLELASAIDAMDSKNIFGQVNSNSYDIHGHPFSRELKPHHGT